MSTAAAIEQTQKVLEQRLAQFELQLTGMKGNPDNNKIEVLSREFQDFKSFAIEMFNLIRKQIAELKTTVNKFEAKSRSDSLLLKGYPEKQGENVYQSVIDVMLNKLNIQDSTTQSFRACYRLGRSKDGVTRSILVTFNDLRLRHQVWSNKTKLKGTQFTLSEYLIKNRQLMFTEARRILGVRNCWTQGGSVMVKLPNGTKKMVLHQSDLDALDKAAEKTGDAQEPVPGQGTHQVRQKRIVSRK